MGTLFWFTFVESFEDKESGLLEFNNEKSFQRIVFRDNSWWQVILLSQKHNPAQGSSVVCKIRYEFIRVIN